MKDQLAVFSGSAHADLAREICALRGVRLNPSVTKHFSNDNLYVQLQNTVREKDVFIVQPFYPPPVSDRVLELLLMLDAARLASAKRVTAVIPYYSYSRSDKKDEPRISIAGRLIADLLQTAGAQRVLTMTLHSPQVHGFFSIPADPLSSRPVFVRHFRERDLSSTIVVAPDIGHAKSAARFASDLRLPVTAAMKERVSDSQVRIVGIVGQMVRGYRRALIYDDEIATGGSILELSRRLIDEGVEQIWVACTHGVFVRGGLEKLVAVPYIAEIVTTDTVSIPAEKRDPKLHVLPVGQLFGEAIRRNYLQQSIGDLFVFGEEEPGITPAVSRLPI